MPKATDIITHRRSQRGTMITYRGAHLLIDPYGEIRHVFVPADRRGQGIATAMFRYAQADDRIPGPTHSASRSDDAERWARSLGGEITPRRIQEVNPQVGTRTTDR